MVNFPKIVRKDPVTTTISRLTKQGIITSPLNLEEFLTKLEKFTGLPLYVMRTVSGSSTISGITLKFADRYLIFYAKNSDKVLENHIIAHEIGHILLQHRIKVMENSTFNIRLFHRDISMDTVLEYLQHTRYDVDHADEREAERFALILFAEDFRLRKQKIRLQETRWGF